MHLYQNKMNYRKEYQKARKVLPKTYKKIRDAFEQEHLSGRKRIIYEKVIFPMREEMMVVENIQCIIFGSSPLLRNTTPEESMERVKEFVLVKKVLHSCCMPHEENIYVYPEIMKSILHEMKMSMRLFELCKAWKDNENIKKSLKIQDFNEKPDAILKRNKDLPYLAKFVSFVIIIQLMILYSTI